MHSFAVAPPEVVAFSPGFLAGMDLGERLHHPHVLVNDAPQGPRRKLRSLEAWRVWSRSLAIALRLVCKTMADDDGKGLTWSDLGPHWADFGCKADLGAWPVEKIEHQPE